MDGSIIAKHGCVQYLQVNREEGTVYLVLNSISRFKLKKVLRDINASYQLNPEDTEVTIKYHKVSVVDSQ